MVIDKSKHSEEWCNMFDALLEKGMDEAQAAKIATSKVGYSEEGAEVYELQDIEVFATGKWKGEEYTEADLDNMVHNFDLLGHKYKAPLKLGHDEKQKLAQADGYPAIGWVKGLKRSGNKLLATFSSVPKKIKQLIDRKAYGRFSSEILWNFNFSGNVHKRVLRGVALLGADMPAVTSINDILSLYSETDVPNGELHAYYELTETGKDGGTMPTVEELQAQLNERDQKLAKLSQDAQSLGDKVKTLEAEKLQREQEAQKAKVYSAIDEGVKAGKIAPVQREYLAALAMREGEQVVQFSDGKESKFNTSLDLLNEMIGKLPVDQKFSGEQSTTENANDEKLSGKEEVEEGGRKYSTGAELDKKIKAIQAEKKCSYTEAFHIASKEDK
jgi:hypothetical protein